MKKLIIFIAIMILGFNLNSFAQQNSIIRTDNINSIKNVFSQYSLLDPAKLDIDQSVSVSYQTNGKQGLMSNMYSNTISYKISEPLTMKLHLGFAHSPSSFSSVLETDQTNFLPGFELTYKPSNDFMIHFEYQTYSTIGTSKGLWGSNRFYNPAMGW